MVFVQRKAYWPDKVATYSVTSGERDVWPDIMPKGALQFPNAVRRTSDEAS